MRAFLGNPNLFYKITPAAALASFEKRAYNKEE